MQNYERITNSLPGSGRWGRLIGLAAAFVSWACSLSADETPPLPTLDDVRSQYIAAVTSLHSVDCRYRVERVLTEREMAALPANRYVAFDSHLLLSGTMRALLREAYNPQGQAITRTWYGFDGKRYAHWTQSLGDPEQWHQMPTGRIGVEHDNYLYDTEGIDRLLGLGLLSGTISLQELLSLKDSHVVGWEDVESYPCVKVVCPDHWMTPKAPDVARMDTTVWLDPTQRCLPRRIEMQQRPGSHPPPYSWWAYQTDEFATVKGEDGLTHLFPRLGWFESTSGKSKIEMRSLAANGTIPAIRFQPQFPDLTRVSDSSQNGKMRDYVMGDAKQRSDGELRITRRQDGEVLNTTNGPERSMTVHSPSAAPLEAEPNRWSTIFALLGVILFVIAATILLRHSQTS
jgi:hypothetical protein